MATAELTLIGTLNYEELKHIHGSSDSLLSSLGWRGNWPADFQREIGKRSEVEQSLTPGQFFERLYHLEDWGVFHLDTTWSNATPLRLDLFFHDSIQPSFQIRASSRISRSLIKSPLDCWQELQTLRRSVCSLVEQFQLRPSIDTITIDVAHGISGSGQKFNKLRGALVELAENEAFPAETASLMEGQAFIARFIVDGRDQYLIVPFTNLGDLAISQLYYLQIAKGKIKGLLTRLKESYEIGLSMLKPEIQNYLSAQKLDETELKKLLSLRGRIANHTTKFRVLENHVDLVIGFLDFHVKSLGSGSSEKPLLRTHPCTIAAERENLQLYYLVPLKTITFRTGELIKDASSVASTITEIMLLRINLKSQKYLERLQVAALVFAMLSAVLVFKTELGSFFTWLCQQFLLWVQTIKR